MTINTLRILTTSGNILEFKIRPSFTLEMEDLIYAILFVTDQNSRNQKGHHP